MFEAGYAPCNAVTIRGYTPEMRERLNEMLGIYQSKTKIPEAKKMNMMSRKIHNHLAVCIEEERGKNALMAYNTIIEERLIAKEVGDNGTYDGTVTYVARKGRFETMKLGRFIKRHILKEDVVPEKAFQKCIEGLVDHFFPTCVFEIHSGDEITRNYENCVGGGSCMAGKHAPKVDMYARNPKKFSQLIGRQNRNTGRAILFHMDDGFTMLGRIYCGTSYLTSMMKAHAKKKGWLYSDGYDLFRKDEAIDHDDYDFTISGVEWKEGGVPYMDIFENASIEGDTLKLYYNGGGDYNLNSCGGMLREGIYCIQCDDEFDIENAYNDGDNYWCPGCFDDWFVICDECEETTHTNNLRGIYDGGVCSSCYDNYYVCCVECNDAFHADNTITLHSGEKVCKSCLEDEYTLCEKCEQYVKETFTVIPSHDEDGRELCEDCKELCYAENG